jgi:hypothetical protein
MITAALALLLSGTTCQIEGRWQLTIHRLSDGSDSIRRLTVSRAEDGTYQVKDRRGDPLKVLESPTPSECRLLIEDDRSPQPHSLRVVWTYELRAEGVGTGQYCFHSRGEKCKPKALEVRATRLREHRR